MVMKLIYSSCVVCELVVLSDFMFRFMMVLSWLWMVIQVMVLISSVLSIVLFSLIRELIENMLVKLLMGLSLLNLGVSELMLNSQLFSISGVVMVVRVIRKVSGIIEMVIFSIWVLSMLNSSVGLKVVVCLKVRVVIMMWFRLVIIGLLKSQMQLLLISSIKVVVNLCECGIFFCLWVCLMCLFVVGLVCFMLLFLVICCIFLLNCFFVSVGVGWICRIIGQDYW